MDQIPSHIINNFKYIRLILSYYISILLQLFKISQVFIIKFWKSCFAWAHPGKFGRVDIVPGCNRLFQYAHFTFKSRLCNLEATYRHEIIPL